MSELAVIGMGRFGRSVVRHLALEGEAVLAIDRDPARLDLVAREADSTLCLDSTDEEALSTLPFARIATMVVTIGSRGTEASLLTVAVLKELGVPRIVARAFDERHARLLRRLGAHEVLSPESEMGRRLALRLAHPGIAGRIELADTTIAEVELPEAFADASLTELDLAGAFGVRVVALCRGETTILHPAPRERVNSGDRAVLAGPREGLERIAALV